MCAKCRTYSIYLLRDGFDSSNAIKSTASLTLCSATNIPAGASMFITHAVPTDPWWKNYWGASFSQQQTSLSSLVFYPYKSHFFVFSFGYAHKALKDNSYEYDFGLIVTLNALKSDELRSADALVLENAKRERMQAPISKDLTFFEIDNDTTIIRSFTGNTKPEYKELMKHITGADNVRVTNKLQSDKLDNLLQVLLDLYKASDYQKTFPNINNIHPEKDPSIIDKLNVQLLSSIASHSTDIELTIPDLIDYQEYFGVCFSEKRETSKIVDDLDNAVFYAFWDEEISIKTDAKQLIHTMKILLFKDEQDINPKSYSLFKCLLFFTSYQGKTYHLCDGSWYEVNADFLKKVNDKINSHFIDNTRYTDCGKDVSEGKYNSDQGNKDVVCLDTENIAKSGNVEPCDLYHIESDKAVFTHIKKSTRSSLLSHLFNQGYVSIRLLKQESSSKEKIKEILKAKVADPVKMEKYSKAIDNDKNYQVEFGIITKKEAANKSENLPLFSRITLLRVIKDLEMLNVDVKVFYIKES